MKWRGVQTKKIVLKKESRKEKWINKIKSFKKSISKNILCLEKFISGITSPHKQNVTHGQFLRVEFNRSKFRVIIKFQVFLSNTNNVIKVEIVHKRKHIGE